MAREIASPVTIVSMKFKSQKQLCIVVFYAYTLLFVVPDRTNQQTPQQYALMALLSKHDCFQGNIAFDAHIFLRAVQMCGLNSQRVQTTKRGTNLRV